MTEGQHKRNKKQDKWKTQGGEIRDKRREHETDEGQEKRIRDKREKKRGMKDNQEGEMRKG